MISAPTRNGNGHHKAKARKEENADANRLASQRRTGGGYFNAIPCEFHNPVDAMQAIPNQSERVDHDFYLAKWIRPSRWLMEMLDAALSCGLRISIVCPHAYAVQIACIVAQLCTVRSFCFYDEQAQRLVFYARNEEQNQAKCEVEIQVS